MLTYDLIVIGLVKLEKHWQQKWQHKGKMLP